MTTAEAYEQALRKVSDNLSMYVEILVNAINDEDADVQINQSGPDEPIETLYVFPDGSCLKSIRTEDDEQVHYEIRVGHAYPVGQGEC